MRTYARIYLDAVVELFSTDGDITQMFHPDLIWIDVTELDFVPEVGWLFDGSNFALPPGPTAEEILAANTAVRDALIGTATARVAPLQDAADLGIATLEEEADLLAWKRYRVALNRLDLTVDAVAWPGPPSN